MGLLWIMAEYLSYVHPFNIIFLDVTSRSLIKAGHSSSKCWCEKLRCLILLHSSLCWSYYLTLDRYAVDSTPHSMQKPSGVPHKPSKKRCKNDENLGPLEDPQRKVQKYITTLGIWQRGPPPQSLSQYLLKPKCELSSKAASIGEIELGSAEGVRRSFGFTATTFIYQAQRAHNILPLQAQV